MGSIEGETDTSLRVIATKCYDTEETGMVNISGWKEYQSEETPILFTVLDKVSRSKWTRLVEDSSSKRSTLKVRIPSSVVHHEIVVIAELLRQSKSCAKDKSGLRCFTVESTNTCVAMATSENYDLELLISQCQGMSTSDSMNGFPKSIVLEIERRSTDLVGLRLTRSSRGVVRWLLTIEEVEASERKDVFLFPADQDTTDFEFQIDDWTDCNIEAIGLDRNLETNLCLGLTSYRTGLPTTFFSLDELHQLHKMAVAYAGQPSALCVWLYRNKKQKYFDDILQNHGGVMKPYSKDNSGDPRSPINGRIDGLFFMASVKYGSKKGEPHWQSAFGRSRVLFPAKELLEKASNLYFTDFYCMSGKTHYVTLVMTRPGSKSDKFCASRLLRLDKYDRSSNPFFFYDENSHQLHVSTKKYFLVELLFTEDINISGRKIKKTPIAKNCRGSSKDGGKPKDPNCSVCNL